MEVDMLELYCQQCGEPWDVEYVQQDMSKTDRERFLFGDGCESCDWGNPEFMPDPENRRIESDLMAVGLDMLGEDLDGLASMIDDFGLLH
jgi:hypothetical protein